MITIKFHLDDYKVFTKSYLETASIQEVKHSVASVFATPASKIDLLHDDTSVSDEKTLNKFVSEPYGIIELNLVSTDEEEYPIIAEHAYKDFAEPDIITVRIKTDDEEYKDVTVEIEDRKIDKPFLGGFVHKNTLVEYHDGYSQTGPRAPKVPPEMMNHRDTQTYSLRHRKTNADYAHATQMTTKDVWIPNVTDKILIAGPYETADEWEERRALLKKVLTIQRYYRAWKIRKELKVLCEEYRRRMAQQIELELMYYRESSKQKRMELIGKVFPRTKYDFDMIFSMIERWKRNEIQRISTNYCGPAKIAELYLLLDKEVEMLRALDIHKQKLKKDAKLRKEKQFFHLIGDPLEWHCSYKNIPVQMDTLETQKGREYYELYAEVREKKSDEEYLETLLKVKLYLKNHTCDVTTELNQLIDRACDLITNGISSKHLDVLQKRIEMLLKHHFEMVDCSEAMNYVTRRKEKLMEGNLFYCHRCEKYKTLEGFEVNVMKGKKIKVCKSCSYYDKSEQPWINTAPYRFMLRAIRRDERMRGSSASYAFLLQDKDIHFIVNDVWKARSAVSESEDIYNLQLCRWFIDEDWAPWNCILLTREEVKEHFKVKDLKAVYDEQFLSVVHSRHAFCKKHFAVMFKLNRGYQEMGEHDTKWNELIELKKYVRVNDDEYL